MALVGFQYELVSLLVNEVFCLDIPNTREKSRKSQSITEWCRYRKYGARDANVECLSCGEFEALRILSVNEYQI